MKKLFLLLLLPFNVSSAQTVAVDVGHHDKDPGATSAYGHSEFSYNQRMAHAVILKLQDYGHTVKPIGYSGKPISLVQRTKGAAGSNFFVSIHHDSVQQYDLKLWEYQGQVNHFNDEEKGFGVFVSAKNPYFQESLSCARIISNHLIQAGFSPNYYHNKNPVNKPRELFFKDEPVYRYDNLVVLKKANMPAVLIEAGVIVNRNEAMWITQDNVRNAFAESVARAITQCIRK